MIVVENERAKRFLPKNYRKQPIRDSSLQLKVVDAHARQAVSRADSGLPIEYIIESSLNRV